MNAADGPTDTAGLATPPDPQPEQDAWPVPPGIAEVHDLLHILSVYGRHLHDTLQARALVRGFATIAQFFGSVAQATILAHLCRGLMRCQALDRLLRARVMRGVDLRAVAPRTPADGPPADGPPGDDATAGAPPADGTAPPAPLTEEQREAARAAAARRAEARVRRRIAASQPLSFATMPSMAEIEAEVRRAPIGRSLVLICRDFGIAPSLCAVPFWNRLFDAFRQYGGSLGQLVLEMRRRAEVYEKHELDRRPELGWPEESRAGVQRVLGFFIGETPVGPSRWMPAWEPGSSMAVPAAVEAFTVLATGPP